MTPAQIETAARRKYNSSSSNFFATAEIYDLIYQAETEIAVKTRMLEGRTTISGGSIASTQSYTLPTGALEIKRVEYSGAKLERIDLRQDDAATMMNSNSTQTGVPQYYYFWNSTLYLRPIPAASSDQIRIYYYVEPALITSATQVLEVPAVWHMPIVDFVVSEMAAKDGQFDMADFYFQRWTNVHIPAMLAWVKKRRTGDQFNMVKDVDTLNDTLLGIV